MIFEAYTIHSTPCTIHHALYTIHYTPYTIHHTLYTMYTDMSCADGGSAGVHSHNA
jgi:hypothetical protein